jgi:hypothetical protein
VTTSALWWYASSERRLVPEELDPRVVRHYHLLALAAPGVFLIMVLLVALGLGRLIDPLLLGGVLGLGYIAVAVPWRCRGGAGVVGAAGRRHGVDR